MKFLGTFILFILAQSLVYGLQNDNVFERISPESGFTFDAITSVIEDDNGFIWFGCNNGLFYYNSIDIVRYNHDPQSLHSPQSNKINKLYKDLNNKIWVCTEKGICYFIPERNSFARLDLKEESHYQKYIYATNILQYSPNEYLAVINNSLFLFDIDEQILKPIKIGQTNNTFISYLGRGSDGLIYTGTNLGEVYVNNNSDCNFKLVYKSKSETSAVKTICVINSILWIGYDKTGVELIDSSGKFLSSYRMEDDGEKKLPSDRVRKIVQRKNGDVWIGTFDGIYVITRNGNKTIKENLYNKLPHNSIYDLFIDKNDGLWVGTWSGGLAFYSDYNFRFEHVQKFSNWLNTPRSVISAFAQSIDGNIWVGSESLGLNKYNLATKSFDINTLNKDGTANLRIKSLASDKNKRLWIGTFNEGLWYFDQTTQELIQPINNVRFPMFIISSISPDDNGIWIGTRDRLFYYDSDTKQIKIYKSDELKPGSISSDKIWKTFIDSKGNLWICTDFGLSLKRKGSESFERFFQNENIGSLSRNIIYTICEDGEGKMWIGTNGGGIDIYNPERNSFEKLDLNEALNKADIYSIIKDHDNNIWFSTNIGIHVYMRATKTLKSFAEQDGLQGMQYNPNSAFITSSGQLFWGGSNGFNRIDSEITIKENPIIPDVFISKFLINNVSFIESKIKSINSYHLAKINHIELKYNQNSLLFSFAANNFIKSTKNRFRYRLRNYQDEWTETSFGKDVAFTKIPSGEYILEVYGSNNDGIWSNEPKQVFIKIFPPFLMSWYAYLLYFIVAGIILLMIMKEIIFRGRVRKDLINERYKNEAAEMLLTEKTKFFTNVSHEFRTPLTLIISPANNLMKKFQHDKSTFEPLNTMKRNADRLLRLTNQMLDFRLLELGKIKMKPANLDIVALSQEICECFDYHIIEKEINFVFSSSFKSLTISLDPDLIEKVIYNLLSNALKFSIDKGQIIFSIDQKELDDNAYSDIFYTANKFLGNAIEIKIKDYGKGIMPNMVPNIFDRFFVDPQNSETGTGIGLHLCKEYVSLLGGNIMVASEKDKGTTFYINLPLKTILDLKKENIIIQTHYDSSSASLQEQSDFSPLNKTKVILLAEDNDELRIYLKNFLLGWFKVLTAKNGNQAMEIALEVIPDLIISDILMPGINGLELTSCIRKNRETNHIPIILLTALSGQNVQLDGVNRGADLFLTKPIDESFLLAQIENILANRENIIEKFGANLKPNGNIDHNLSFIELAEKYILDNIRNVQLDINLLARELNISRSSLHRKLISQTNQSATEFIRDIRLKYSVRLMKIGKYNMDEIAVMAGFNSTSYFNRSFRKKYGKTPREYHTELNKSSHSLR